MGVGRINVWIPGIYNGNCIIDNYDTYVATVQNCDGSILEWKGGRYQTKDGAWHQIVGDPSGSKPGVPGYYDGVPGTGDPGHVAFEVPPGCYQISASTHVWYGPHEGTAALWGNLLTHKAIKQVRCNEDACVTLYQPSGAHCWGAIWELLIPVMASKGQINREELAIIEKAILPISQKLVLSESEKGDLEIAKTIVKRLTVKKGEKT